MLYFDIIDVSEGININKTSASKECYICHYWYFFKMGFSFQLNACNACNEQLMMFLKLSDIAILSISSSDYCCNIRKISKNESKKEKTAEKSGT